MSLVSDSYPIYNHSPQTLWDWLHAQPSLLLPQSINQNSFNHYYEISGTRFGFQLNPPWQLMPDGPWSVLIENLEQVPAERMHYKITIDREEGYLYKGELAVQLKDEEGHTNVQMEVSGERMAGLSGVTDEFVETILRSLMRESRELIEAKLDNRELPLITHANLDDEDHIAPLAVAAGVFSAGMALSLWLWRRKKRKG